nr:TIGR03943 family protein [Microbacterium sp. BK668]
MTLTLAATGRLGLYLNPDSTWFAVTMAVVVLVGAALTFALPLGAEDDEHAHEGHEHHRRNPFAVVATAVGGVAASVFVLVALVAPPASLSAELAMSRDIDAPPLFAGADAVALATTGDTAEFGIGEWSTVFATATNPDAYDGDPVTLTGFVTPGDDGFDLTRLIITHCVIDAQPASIPVDAAGTGRQSPTTGQWVTVTGTVRSSTDGSLAIVADSVELIDEPGDPYEY